MSYYNLNDFKVWNRRLFNFYWISIFLYFIIDVVCSIVSYKNLFYKHIFNSTYIYITLVLLFIMTLGEIIIFHNNKLTDYVIILYSSLISFLFVFFQPILSNETVLFLLPFFISIYYFEKRKIIISAILNMFFITICFLFNNFQGVQSITQFIATVFVIILSGIIFTKIVSRSVDVCESFKKMLKSEQDLIIKNTCMEQLTKLDALTNLYNHMTFYEYLGHLVEQHEQNHLLMQLAVIDIDDFKKINDTYGHKVGDLILKMVASKIKEVTDANDIVSRYGGEEFTVIFTDKSFEKSHKITENIRKEIENMHIDVIANNITISIGLHNHLKGESKEMSFTKADSLLYIAKRTGKNKVVTDSDIKN